MGILGSWLTGEPVGHLSQGLLWAVQVQPVLALAHKHSFPLSPLWLRALFVLQLQYKHGSIWNREMFARIFWVC